MKRIRTVLIQPALPAYRIPLFRELAARPEIELRVLYGKDPGLENVEPSGFKAEYAPQREFFHGRAAALSWHEAHYLAACRKECDVWIANWNVRFLSLWPALVRARWEGVGTVFWGHGYSKQDSFLRIKLRKKLGSFADASLFYDHETAEAYQRMGLDSERVFVAPNALEQSQSAELRGRWLEEPQRLAQFKAQHGLGSQVILFVGRSYPARRLDVLVRALASLPEAQLILIGGGESQAKLQALADQLGVGDRVRQLGPMYEQEDLAPWFLSSSVFCCPSAIGLSLHHAFGYGLPVVVGDDTSRHNPEISAFRSGYNGLSFSHDDPAALSQKLSALLGDARQRENLSRGALETAQRFSITQAVDGIVEAVKFAHAAAR